ncbi:MAG: aldehyde dehydrogenase family protein [Verrucomicrobiota bacterium]
MTTSGQSANTSSPTASVASGVESQLDIVAALAKARAAQVRWQGVCLTERLRHVRQLRRLLADNAALLADASASARHRPRLESLLAEVMPLAEACRFLERSAKRILQPRRLGFRGLPMWLFGVASEIHREPHGVVLVIGPGNYPLLLPGAQVIQALVAGNAVLLKPGLGGTAAARELLRLLDHAGFDRELVVLLPETSAVARQAIEAGPDKVIFTGSAATGEVILGQLAPRLIPATMELSGSDAVIVRDDADLFLVVQALVFGLSINAGATCMAPKRVFVSASRVTELEGRLAAAFSSPTDGGPEHSGSDRQQKLATVLAAMASHEKIRPLLTDALDRGAHLVAGKILDDGSLLVPIILSGVAADSKLLQADVFAPVLAIVTVETDAEAVRLANDNPYGLAASVFSRNAAAAKTLAAKLKAGFVCINDLIIPTADARVPFGGRGRSGFGVTRGAEGLLELTVPKVVSHSRFKFRPAFQPRQLGDEQFFRAYLKLTHGGSWRGRWQGLTDIFRVLRLRRKARSLNSTSHPL